MADEMSVSRIVFDRDENHLPYSDADRDWLLAKVERLTTSLRAASDLIEVVRAEGMEEAAKIAKDHIDADAYDQVVAAIRAAAKEHVDA